MEDFDFSTLYHDYIKTFLALYALVCVFFSYMINRFLLRFIKTLGTRNTESLIRWNSESKPSIGGLSFYITFLFSVIIFSIFFDPEVLFQNQSYLGLLLACSLAFLLGLSDDAYNTRPLLKFTTQLFCGILIVSTGNILQIFQIDGANIVVTVLWVVGIMNAINMLDNMDGVSGVTSLFIMIPAGASAYYFAYITSADAFLAVGLVGALLGFLILNSPPSKIFMGDTGAMFLGVVLSYFGIKYIFNAHVLIDGLSVGYGFLLLLTVFLLPITDTTTVVINRIMKGNSPLLGGKDHTTHCLVYKGWSEKKVMYFFAAVGAVNTGWAILFLSNKVNEVPGLLYVNILYLILLSSSLFYNTRLHNND